MPLGQYASTEQKYIKHLFHKNVLITQHPNIQKRTMQLPVCPKCERPALRDTRKDDPNPRYITCPMCGYHGPFTHTVALHMQEHI